MKNPDAPYPFYPFPNLPKSYTPQTMQDGYEARERGWWISRVENVEQGSRLTFTFADGTNRAIVVLPSQIETAALERVALALALGRQSPRRHRARR